MILAIIVWTKSTHKISFIQSYINESIKLWWIWLRVPIYIILKFLLQPIIQRRLFFWLICLQSFINVKLFQCRNVIFLRLGIIIIITITTRRSFIILIELEMAHILLMFILLPQTPVTVKGKQIMSSHYLSRRGFIQFVCACSRSTHSYKISCYYSFGSSIKLCVSSSASALWNVFIWLLLFMVLKKVSISAFLILQKKNSLLQYPWSHIFSNHTLGMKTSRLYFKIIHAWFY